MPIPTLNKVFGANNSNEIDFSVKESVHAWNREIPVDITLSSADTAQDLINLDTEFRESAVNIILNPSFEGATTGFTDDGATNSKQATTPRNGSNTMRLVPANSAVEEGAYINVDAAGGAQHFYLIASAWFRDAASAGDDGRIKIQDSSGTDLVDGNTLTVSTTYQRSIAVYKMPATAAQYRIWVGTVSQHGTSLFVDDVQVEIRDGSSATDFVNATGGERWSTFQSTAEASMSQRLDPMTIIKGFDLTFDKDTLIAFDQTTDLRTVTAADREKGIFVAAGTKWNPDWPIDIRERISFVNANSGETPRIYGVVWGRSKL